MTDLLQGNIKTTKAKVYKIQWPKFPCDFESFCVFLQY